MASLVIVTEALHILRDRLTKTGTTAFADAARQPIQSLLKLRLHPHTDGPQAPLNTLLNSLRSALGA